MFNGIISFLGKIASINQSLFSITSNVPLEDFSLGSSIACSGVCLTIIDFSDKHFFVEVSKVTLLCTNLGKWRLGSIINLEPALKVGQSLNGHFISGHIDCVVEILKILFLEDGCCKVIVKSPESFMKYIVCKGSISLDGVSLTINEVHESTFSVNLLPYTFKNTTFQYNKIGDKLNMEIDILARYAEKLISLKTSISS